MTATHPDLDLKLLPNVSIDAGTFAVCLLPAMLIPVVAGAAFAVAGAWLVLPFAGLEIALLGVAWVANRRRALQYERITLHDGRVAVEIGDGRRRTRQEFNSAWVQLREIVSTTGYRLVIRAHGREIEIGRHCDVAGRRVLAASLRDKLAR